jgi:16S rRNA (cytidine1402-2'-O)-methyltransferase
MGNRQAVLARELTKIYEEVLRGTLEELMTIADKRKLKGEITIVIAGFSKKNINKGS